MVEALERIHAPVCVCRFAVCHRHIYYSNITQDLHFTRSPKWLFCWASDHHYGSETRVGSRGDEERKTISICCWHDATTKDEVAQSFMVQGRRCAPLDNLFESCVLSSCGASTLRISISESTLLVANHTESWTFHPQGNSMFSSVVFELKLDRQHAGSCIALLRGHTRDETRFVNSNLFYFAFLQATVWEHFSARPRTLFWQTSSNRLLQPDLESSFAQREYNRWNQFDADKVYKQLGQVAEYVENEKFFFGEMFLTIFLEMLDF